MLKLAERNQGTANGLFPSTAAGEATLQSMAVQAGGTHVAHLTEYHRHHAMAESRLLATANKEDGCRCRLVFWSRTSCCT